MFYPFQRGFLCKSYIPSRAPSNSMPKRLPIRIAIGRLTVRGARLSTRSPRMASTAARWWTLGSMAPSACAVTCAGPVSAPFLCCRSLPYLRFSVSILSLFLAARLLQGATLAAAAVADGPEIRTPSAWMLSLAFLLHRGKFCSQCGPLLVSTIWSTLAERRGIQPHPPDFTAPGHSSIRSVSSMASQPCSMAKTSGLLLATSQARIIRSSRSRSLGIPGSVSRRNAAGELCGQFLRDGKSHLPGAGKSERAIMSQPGTAA